MSDDLETAKCPQCGQPSLDINLKLRAKELGSFSLAGQQVKVSAEWLPILFCCRHECDYEQWGQIEGKHAVFRK